MKTNTVSQQIIDYQRIESAIAFLEEHTAEQPSLEAIAQHVGVSMHHFARLFKQFAGVAPHQFLQFLTLQHAKAALATTSSVLEASLAVGLSSPSRLHDLLVTFEAVTPGQYTAAGRGLMITYGVHETPLGYCCIATTSRGICWLSFISECHQAAAHARSELKKNYPHALLTEDQAATAPFVAALFMQGSSQVSLPVHVRGTNFQMQVWQALLKIPAGSLVSYEQVAQLLGKPTATRAVANAIATNPISLLIPCHRVIMKSGVIHNYRWGRLRKKIMIGYEAAHARSEEI